MNRLRFLRTQKGESLEKIAKYLNVTIQTVSNYETEKRDMTPDTIIKLAEYFGVTTDYLLGKSDIRSTEKTNYINNNELQSYYDELNDLGKQKATEYVKDLTDTPKYIKEEKNTKSQNA